MTYQVLPGASSKKTAAAGRADISAGKRLGALRKRLLSSGNVGDVTKAV
jgi:hypothetical protein